MSPRLPDPLARLFDAVDAATQQVVAAARTGDPETLLRAVERRGRAADDLAARLQLDAGRLDEAQRLLLAGRGEALERGAAAAQEALRAVTTEIRMALLSLEKGAQAARGYAAGAAPAGAAPSGGFDRSG
ncbi:MAG TPA: hypothetical protein VFT43_08255 [Candidatus Polarisedimenticolia bacterium]|nr:hypothetical protein [Candidatus Polarisedimenticolia bacterium]